MRYLSGAHTTGVIDFALCMTIDNIYIHVSHTNIWNLDIQTMCMPLIKRISDK